MWLSGPFFMTCTQTAASSFVNDHRFNVSLDFLALLETPKGATNDGSRVRNSGRNCIHFYFYVYIILYLYSSNYNYPINLVYKQHSISSNRRSAMRGISRSLWTSQMYHTTTFYFPVANMDGKQAPQICMCVSYVNIHVHIHIHNKHT